MRYRILDILLLLLLFLSGQVSLILFGHLIEKAIRVNAENNLHMS